MRRAIIMEDLDLNRLGEIFDAQKQQEASEAQRLEQENGNRVNSMAPIFEERILPNFYRRAEETLLGDGHFKSEISLLEAEDQGDLSVDQMDLLWSYAYSWLERQGLRTERDFDAWNRTLRVKVASLKKVCGR